MQVEGRVASSVVCKAPMLNSTAPWLLCLIALVAAVAQEGAHLCLAAVRHWV